MNTESNINMNGTVNNFEEENNMANFNELMNAAEKANVKVNGIDLAELVAQAAEEAKYSGFKSFFVTKDGYPKDYLKVGDYLNERSDHRITDAAYIIPKDKTKEEFAVVTTEGNEQFFTYVNRTGKEFIKKLVEICKSQRMSMVDLLIQVPVYISVNKKMRKGHENEGFAILADGTCNWFYDYEIKIIK